MLQFTVASSCTRCGLCVADCPARVIVMPAEGLPDIPAEKAPGCYKCQHCLAICPVGAVSILGLKPAASTPLAGNYPEPAQLATLIKGRRSVRSYLPQELSPEQLRQLLGVAWHAPTGVNSRSVRFTVVETREKLAELRQAVMAGLAQLVAENLLPERLAFFAHFVRVWEERRQDIIFRDAPHLLIASAPAGVATPEQDCLIALSYFELFAQANGLGTVWNGLAKWAFELLPDCRQRLGLPDDHQLGYVMSFGLPAVRYARTVQHEQPLIFPVP